MGRGAGFASGFWGIPRFKTPDYLQFEPAGRDKITASRYENALACSPYLRWPSLPSAQVTFDRLLNANKEPQNWLTYSGTMMSQRYSLLTQITPANAKDLEPSNGRYKTHDHARSLSRRPWWWTESCTPVTPPPPAPRGGGRGEPRWSSRRRPWWSRPWRTHAECGGSRTRRASRSRCTPAPPQRPQPPPAPEAPATAPGSGAAAGIYGRSA